MAVEEGEGESLERISTQRLDLKNIEPHQVGSKLDSIVGMRGAKTEPPRAKHLVTHAAAP